MPPEKVYKHMYASLLFFHSLFRWLVLASLLSALFVAARGYFGQGTFTKTHNALRHWTATIAQVQLMIGFALYFTSPVVKYFTSNFKEAIQQLEFTFFGLIHIGLMFTAVSVLSSGSALAKRRPTDAAKFKTMLIWYSLALLIIFLAIPWPFSPLAQRPYFRPF
ncbi:hypothetical protein [Rhabdobacter roseus]|nr:hypothetical protein [Rhabdobacter roseus]